MAEKKTKPVKKKIDSFTIRAFRSLDKVVRVGDCVLITPLKDGDPPYVARVDKLEADDMNNVSVSVRWYYRPEETEEGRRQFHGVNEVFLSDHDDVQMAETIQRKCTIHSYENYRKLDSAGDEDYFCRFEYKATTTKDFKPNCVAVYCKCEMPYNPDNIMVHCEGECEDWFHPSCIGLCDQYAKSLKPFHCPNCRRTLHDKASVETEVEPKRQKT